MTTHQERFAEACKTTDFEKRPELGGYKVWEVTDIVKGGRQGFDGPYFTEEEATVSAELWQATSERRCARAMPVIYDNAWRPCPVRDQAVKEDAMAARMILAELIGAEIPKPSAAGASRT
ncbi:MAG: hypothetical protein JWQ69_5772 [Pseudomonas sp.]|nr:hypothetical protein [Pseudomonas sp.]